MGRTGWGTRVVVGLWILLGVVGGVDPSWGDEGSEAAQRGRQWLLTVRPAGGSWTSARDPRGLRTTARVVAALGPEASLEAVLWLAAQRAQTLEEATAASAALGPSVPEGLLSPLSSHRVGPGRWGAAPGERSDPYHTCLAVAAQAATGRAEDLSDALAYLADTQNADGSWSLRGEGQETAAVTAEALAALAVAGVPTASSMVSAARGWLISHQNPDGGWGIGGSVPSATARVLAALRWVGLPPDAEGRAVGCLERAQSWDGSWGGDPWTTALVVSALSRAGLPDPGFAAQGVAAAPDPVPGDPWSLDVAVGNRGSVAASPVVAFQVTDAQGTEIAREEQVLDRLEPGDERRLSFAVDTSRLEGSYAWSVTLDPEDLLREGDEGDNRRTGTFRVGGWRDLTLVEGSVGVWTADGELLLDPATLSAGTPVQIRARVAAEGTHGAGPVEVWAFWGSPDAGLLLGSATIEAIAPGQTADVSIPWTLDAPPGPGRLTVVVDPRALVAQTERGTDRGELQVSVGSEDREPPPAPTGLQAELVSRDRVELTWSAPADAPDVVGYRVYRNGWPVGGEDLTPLATPSASDSYNQRAYLPDVWRDRAAFDPPNLTDGDPATAWWSAMLPYEPGAPDACWVRFDFPRPQSFRGAIVHWWDFDVGGEDLRLQTWDGRGWVDQLRVQGNALDRTVLLLDEAVVTDRVRIAVDRGLWRWFLAIREVELVGTGPGRVVAEPRFADDALAGLPATYTVTAVDAAGNESPPSEPFVLRDQVPPVVEIASPEPGRRVGPEVVVFGTVADAFLQGYSLDWVEGAHPTGPVAQWNRVFQRAEPVQGGALFTWRPPPGASGPYTLRVSALDGGGAENAREARVVVEVDTVAPARPEGLSWTLDEDRLVLTWQPNGEGDLAGYLVTLNGKDPGLQEVTREGVPSAGEAPEGEGAPAPSLAVDGKPWTYWRPAKEGYPCTWQLDFPEPRSVAKVQLRWQAPMVPKRLRVETRGADGSWAPRWSAEENRSAVTWAELDAAVPVTGVRVVVLEGATLASADVAGEAEPAPYPALSEVAVLAQTALAEPRFETALAADGEYGLTVQAVDDLGNRSPPSQAAVVDLRGPLLAIYTPEAGAHLGPTVTVQGRVDDRYLREYLVEVGRLDAPGGEPERWEEIHRGVSPVGATWYGDWLFGHVGGGMYPWNRVLTVWRPVLREGWFALRLRAWDQLGNASEARSEFQLDAMPPEAPGNLRVVDGGAGVCLAWDPSGTGPDEASAAGDLAGYRVYRDGIPLSVSDVAFLGVVHAPQFGPEQGLPQWMADGNPDSGWAPRPFADQAEIVLDLPQPYLVGEVGIDWGAEEWLWGRDFQVDLWDPAGGAWVPAAQVAEHVGPRWRQEISPRATDRVRITLLGGPTGYSLGAVRELHLIRAGSADLLGETAYSDPAEVAEETSYRVTAVDRLGNESPKSNPIRIDPVAPRVALTAPAEGELRGPAGTSVPVWGTVEDALLREYRLEVGAGREPLFWETIGHREGDLASVRTPSFLWNWKVPENEEGWFTFRLSAVDAAGHRGEDRVSVYVDTSAPQPPTGLQAIPVEGGVSLVWAPGEDGDLAGYRVYRNGKRLDRADVAPLGAPSASSFPLVPARPPERALDGTPHTGWTSLWMQIPAWFRLRFDGRFPVTGLTVEWDPWRIARAFEVQAWDPEAKAWEEVARVEENDGARSELSFPEPLRVDDLRLRMTRPLESRADFGIRELHLWRAPGAETPEQPAFFDDAVGELEYSYRVTAVDAFGNESLPSGEVLVDGQAPRVRWDAPQELERVGSRVELQGAVVDGRLLDYRLEVGRGEHPEAYAVAGTWTRAVPQGVVAAWDPPPGEDGPWRLRLVARDRSGQETAVERTVWVDTTPPPAPSGVRAAAVGEDAVEVTWDPAEAPDLSGYRVYRGDVLLNDAEVTSWGVPSASWRDPDAGDAVDGTQATGWRFAGAPGYPWWELRYPGEVRVDRVELFWGGEGAYDYEFQIWDGATWTTVQQVWGNPLRHRIHTLPNPVAGTGFRIVLTRWGERASLAEARLWDGSRGGLLSAERFADRGLSEVGWTYRVAAVDDRGNESPLSEPAMVDTRPPQVVLTVPGPDATVTGPVEVEGSATDANLAWWRLEVGEGVDPQAWAEIGFGQSSVSGTGWARWVPPPDAEGTYSLRLSAMDRSGQEAEARVSVYVKTRPLDPPGSLEATLEPGAAPDGSDQVVLRWSPPASGEPVGYNVYRNGERLNRADLAPLAEPAASSARSVEVRDARGEAVATGEAAAAVDPRLDRVWAPEAFVFPAWYALEFDQTHPVGGVAVDWFEDVEGRRLAPADYQIQLREGDRWRTAVFVENNREARRYDALPEPTWTDGIRILITRGPEWFPWCPGALARIQVLSAGDGAPVDAPTFTDGGLAPAEGVYAVAAVDARGRESPWVTVTVDETPPRVQVTEPQPRARLAGAFTLRAAVEEGTLSEWEVAYRVPGGEWQVAARGPAAGDGRVAVTVSLPAGWVLEGEGEVRLRAWDRAGNRGEQVIPVSWDTAPPDPPAGLAAQVSPQGGATLSWIPSPSEDVEGYLVVRNGRTLNPGNLAEGAVASASGVYRDSDYHRPWAALDGQPHTAWWSGFHNGPKVFEAAFADPTVLGFLRLAFDVPPFAPVCAPGAFRVEAWVDGGWELLADVSRSSETCASRPADRQWALRLPEPVAAERVRITTGASADGAYAVGIRELELQGAGLVAGTRYEDRSLDAAETSYQVIAVDRAGNRSAPSAPAVLDDRAPRVVLERPEEGGLAGGVVTVEGRVEDPNLQGAALAWGPGEDPGEWTPLGTWGRFAGTVRADWASPAVAGPVTVRLEAWDAAGNRSEVRRTFSVDGAAPGAPGHLEASVADGAVTLAWEPPSDADVAGYRIYRDGLRLTSDDVSPFGVPWSGSGGTPSAAVDDNPDSHWFNDQSVAGPVAWGVDFDEPFQVDGVELEFYEGWYHWYGTTYSTVPAAVVVEGWCEGAWVVLATVDENEAPRRMLPFEPVALSRLRLRFPARDGATPLVGLTEVRVRPTGAQGPVPGARFVDLHLADPLASEHLWSVAAVDRAGNEGPRSAPVPVDGLAPRVALSSPRPGERIGGPVEVRGEVRDAQLTGWGLTVTRDGQPPETVASGEAPPAGAVLGIWRPPEGWEGEAVVTLRAADAAGHPASVEVPFRVDTRPPASPGTPAVDGEAGGWIVSWAEPPDADVAGYRVLRNGVPLQASNLATPASVRSEGVVCPDRAADGDPSTVAWGGGTERAAWWGVAFGVPQAVAAVEIQWGAEGGVPRAPQGFAIQALQGDAWTGVRRLEGQEASTGVQRFDPPLVAEGVRLLGDPGEVLRLAEVRVVPAGSALVEGTRFRDVALEGVERPQAEYRVVAVDRAGNESAPSQPVRLDAVPPAVELRTAAGPIPAGTAVAGRVADPLLERWELAVSFGGQAWEVLATGAEGVDGTLLERWEPPPGFVGDARLRLTAWDRAGHEAVCTEVVPVDGERPPAPGTPAARLTDEGVELTWDPVAAPDLAGYRVYRNGVPLDGNLALLAAVTDAAGRPLEAALEAGAAPVLTGPYPVVELRWDHPVAVGRVEAALSSSSSRAPAHVSLDLWTGEGWQTVAEVRDNRDPRLVLAPSLGAASDRVRLMVRDGAGASYSLAGLRVEGAGAGLIAEPGVAFPGLFDPQDVYTVVAVDRAGNEGEPSPPVVLDARPPEVRIAEPAEGALVGRGEIRGTAADPTLAGWALSWRREGTEEPWAPVASGAASREDSLLGSWSPPEEEGGALLRLEAVDRAGNENTHLVRVRYDGAAPALELRAESRYWLPGAPAPVAVAARDGNPSSTWLDAAFPLDLAPRRLALWDGVSPPETYWIDTGPWPRGVVQLHLGARDAVGNRASTSLRVNVARVAFRGEGPAGAGEKPAGRPVALGVASGELWTLDGNGAVFRHGRGEAGSGTRWAAVEDLAGGPLDLEVAPETLWVLGAGELRGLPRDSDVAETAVPLPGARALALRPGGGPAVLRGAAVETFDPGGHPEEAFELPEPGVDLAVDLRGYVHVLGASGAVHVFTPEGEPAYSLPAPRDPGGLPWKATCLAVDSHGRVALGGAGDGQALRLLTGDGREGARFGLVGTGAQEIGSVADLAFEGEELVVLDAVRGRWLAFAPRLEEGPLAFGAAVRAPEAGAHLRGVVPVVITVGEAAAAWRLEEGPADGDGPWALLARGDGPVLEAVAARWDTRGLAPGGYALRLVTLEADGEVVREVPVRVDNDPPVVCLTSPETGTGVDGEVAIRGEVDDEALETYRVWLREPAGGEPLLLAQGAAPRPGEPLARWDAGAARGGVYELVLEAVDRAGNRTEARATVSVGEAVFVGAHGEAVFSRPSGLDRLPDGRWVVADRGTQTVHLVPPSGGVGSAVDRNDLGTPFSWEGPTDVAAVPGGGFAVLDRGTGRVSLYDLEGAPVGGFGGKGDGPGRFAEPVALAVAPDGRLIVLDAASGGAWTHKRGFQVFEPDGSWALSVEGHPALGAGGGLADVAVDRWGHVLVLDRLGRSVAVFSREGAYVERVDLKGAVDGYLEGLAADPGGRIVVGSSGTAADTRRISLLSPQGVPLARFGAPGGGEGAVEAAHAVWIGGQRVGVVGAGSPGVRVFDLSRALGGGSGGAAALEVPEDGDRVPERFRVIGTVPGGEGLPYRVEAGLGGDPPRWQVLGEGDGAGEGIVLAGADLSGLPEGEVTLRLIVEGERGWSEDRVVCRLDRTAPAVALVDPEPFGTLHPDRPVAFRVAEDGPVAYTLALERADLPGTARTLAVGDRSVAEGLAPWPQGEVPPGVYRLILVARDAAGNEARDERLVSVGPVRYAGETVPSLGSAAETFYQVVADGETFLGVTTRQRVVGFDLKGEPVPAALDGVALPDLRQIAVFPDGVAGLFLHPPYVRLYDRRGVRVTAFGGEGPGAAVPERPTGLRADRAGQLWITGPRGVAVCTPEGELLGRPLAGRVAGPVGLDRWGNRYLLLPDEGRVEVLDPDGSPLSSIEETEGDPRWLRDARALAVSPEGRLAVLGADGLAVAGPDGRLLARWAGAGLEGFATVRSPFWGPGGNLYSARGSRVLVLDVGALFPPPSAGLEMAFPEEGQWVRERFPVIGAAAAGSLYTVTVEGEGGAAAPAAGTGSGGADLLAVADLAGLPEGSYTVRLEAEIPSGPLRLERTVHLDRTPPRALLTDPGPFAAVAAPRTVVGEVADPNLEGWTLELGWADAQGREHWSPLAAGSEAVDGPLGVLDPAEFAPGTYRLRLTARDRAGQIARADRPVSLGPLTLTAAVEVRPGDPALGSAQGEAVGLADGSWLVVPSGGPPLRFAADGTFLGEAPLPEALGGRLPEAVAASAHGAVLAARSGQGVSVGFLDDGGQGPSGWTVPAGEGPGRVGILRGVVVAGEQVLLLEPHEVEVFDRSGTYLDTWGREGSDPGEFTSLQAGAADGFGRILLLDGDGRLHLYSREGEYRGETVLRDPGGQPVLGGRLAAGPRGNLAVLGLDRAWLYRSDGRLVGALSEGRTGPGSLRDGLGLRFTAPGVVEFWDRGGDAYPGQGRLQTVSVRPDAWGELGGAGAIWAPEPGEAVPGDLWVTGAVGGEGPVRWELAVGAGGEPAVWTVLAAGDRPVAGGVLGRWSAAQAPAPEGVYTLRLTVEGAEDRVEEVRRPVVLDRSAPRITWETPAPLDLLEGPFAPVTASLEEAHPARWGVEYLDAANRWQPVAGGRGADGPVEASWEIDGLAPGAYPLRLWAVDAAGNRASEDRLVSTSPVRFAGAVSVAAADTPAAASRDGRVAVVSADRSSILVYDSRLTLLYTLRPPPGAGWGRFTVEHLSFADSGELLALGSPSGGFLQNRRVVRWGAEGREEGVLDLDGSAPGYPGEVRALAALPDGQFVLAASRFETTLGRYALPGGFLGEVDVSGSGVSLPEGVLPHPGRRLLLWGKDRQGRWRGGVIEPSGAPVRPVGPLEGWSGAGAPGVDGSGCLLLAGGGGRVTKFDVDGAPVWTFGLRGTAPGRFAETPWILGGGGARWFAWEPRRGRLQAFGAWDACRDPMAPSVALAPFAGGELPAGPVVVAGTVADDNLAFWTLEAVPVGTGEAPVPVARGAARREHARLAVWDASGLAGDWVLRLDAVDTAGNRATEAVGVRIAPGPPPDRDGDGLSDPSEIVEGTDPGNPDTDGDGVFDGTERGLTAPEAEAAAGVGRYFIADADPSTATRADDADTDEDGLLDGYEDRNANGRWEPELGETDPLSPDTDGDGIPDATEGGWTAPQLPEATDLAAGAFVADADPATRTDPLNPDTDGDGVADGEEDANRNGRREVGEGDPLAAPCRWDGEGDGDVDGADAARVAEALPSEGPGSAAGVGELAGELGRGDCP